MNTVQSLLLPISTGATLIVASNSADASNYMGYAHLHRVDRRECHPIPRERVAGRHRQQNSDETARQSFRQSSVHDSKPSQAASFHRSAQSTFHSKSFDRT